MIAFRMVSVSLVVGVDGHKVGVGKQDSTTKLSRLPSLR